MNSKKWSFVILGTSSFQGLERRDRHVAASIQFQVGDRCVVQGPEGRTYNGEISGLDHAPGCHKVRGLGSRSCVRGVTVGFPSPAGLRVGVQRSVSFIVGTVAYWPISPCYVNVVNKPSAHNLQAYESTCLLCILGYKLLPVRLKTSMICPPVGGLFRTRAFE